MADETTQPTPTATAEAATPAAKKEKPPAVEDKPLPDFIAQDCLPALKQKLEGLGLSGLDLTFGQQQIGVKGYSQLPDCWQIVGKWQVDGLGPTGGQRQLHQFNVYFFDADLQGQRGFSSSLGGTLPSTMESFRIDERKMSLDLLISGILQRLNSQKWLARN